MKILKLLLPAILLVISTHANSAIVTFTDRSAFQAAAGTTATEDFNSAPIGIFGNAGLGLDLGNFTLKGTDPFLGRIDNGDLFSIDGSLFARTVTSIALSSDLIFNFNTAITAFGLDLNGFNDDFIKTTIWLDDLINIPITSTDGNVIEFLGFTSDTAFNSIRFVGGVTDGFGIDNIEYSVSAVPVPASAWLFGSALLGFFGFTRKNSVNARLAKS